MKKDVRESIVEAAVLLFNNRGYNGTTMRDIAKRAGVNIANIAYYFENKHGLLEHCLIIYFEQYVDEIEQSILATEEENAQETLKEIAKRILVFHSENSQLTRFVLREVSLDSQVISEIMTTYYRKERFYLKEVFAKGVDVQKNKHTSIDYLILQFKALLGMPYLNAYYVKEVLHMLPNESYFAKRYLQEVETWIDYAFHDVHAYSHQ